MHFFELAYAIGQHAAEIKRLDQIRNNLCAALDNLASRDDLPDGWKPRLVEINEAALAEANHLQAEALDAAFEAIDAMDAYCEAMRG
jgi:hypothetical protein